MSAIATSAPARASVSASARPSPREPPVTSATRPERSISIATREEDLARDHEPLDLRGALVDLEQLRVAHQLLDRIFLHVAVAAEDLHGVGREDLARDHEPLDLRGALVDLEQLRVAHQLLDRIFLHVAVAAEDLHGVGR